MAVILLLLQYLIIPLFCAWMIARACIKAAEQFDKQDQGM